MHQAIPHRIRESAQSIRTQEAPHQEGARTTSISKPTMLFIKFRIHNPHHLCEIRFKCIRLQRTQIKREQDQAWTARSHRTSIPCTNLTIFQWPHSNQEESPRSASIIWWINKLTHYKVWTTKEWTWQWDYKSIIWTTCRTWQWCKIKETSWVECLTPEQLLITVVDLWSTLEVARCIPCKCINLISLVAHLHNTKQWTRASLVEWWTWTTHKVSTSHINLAHRRRKDQTNNQKITLLWDSQVDMTLIKEQTWIFHCLQMQSYIMKTGERTNKQTTWNHNKLVEFKDHITRWEARWSWEQPHQRTSWRTIFINRTKTTNTTCLCLDRFSRICLICQM